jgi:plastocyanin
MKSGRLISFTSLILTLGLASACGSSSDETPDAAPDGSGSGGGPKAQIVNCTSAVTKEIKTVEGELKFTPASMTIAKGTIVKFIMSPSHDAHSGALFTVNSSETACVQFNAVGTYTFLCAPHGFSGSVIVQ